jgi:hypothetical protein
MLVILSQTAQNIGFAQVYLETHVSKFLDAFPTYKTGASPQEWRNVENMGQFHKNGAMEILHGQEGRNHVQKRSSRGQKRRIPAPKSKTICVSERTAHARNFSGNQMKHCFARPASKF